MRRREFIGLIGGAAATWPLVARAQQPGTPKVGYVGISERGTDVSGAGLRQGLVDKGYEIGRNLMFEGRAISSYFWKRFGKEVCRPHAVLHHAERMFDCLATLAHGLWV